MDERAVDDPGGGVRLEAAVRHIVRGAARDLDVVQEKRAILERREVESRLRSLAPRLGVAPDVTELDPGRLPALVARLPGDAGGIVLARIDQLEARAVAIGQFRPVAAFSVLDLVHGIAHRVLEADGLAVVLESTGPRAHDVG